MVIRSVNIRVFMYPSRVCYSLVGNQVPVSLELDFERFHNFSRQKKKKNNNNNNNNNKMA